MQAIKPYLDIAKKVYWRVGLTNIAFFAASGATVFA